MRNSSLWDVNEPQPKQSTLKTNRGFWPGRFSIQIIISNYDAILGSAVVRLSHAVLPNEVQKALKRIGLTMPEDLEHFGVSSSIRYSFQYDEIQLIRQYFEGDENIRIYEISQAKIHLHNRDGWLSKNTIEYSELSKMLGSLTIGQVIQYVTSDNHEIENSGNEYAVLELKRQLQMYESKQIL